MAINYLVARPGHLALPEFQTVATLQPTIEEGDNPYVDLYQPRNAGYPNGDLTQFWIPPPTDVVSPDAEEDPFGEPEFHPPRYLWGSTYVCASDKLVPSIKIDGQTLQPDKYPINGHQSWGGGKVRWMITDIGVQNGLDYPPRAGYVYEKRKTNTWGDNRLFTYYWPDDKRWYMDGWYEIDLDYYDAYTTGSMDCTPRGTCLNDAATSSVISASLDWTNLYYGGSLTSLTSVSDLSSTKSFGYPVWKGTVVEFNISADTQIVGLPTYDEEKQQMDMKFVWDRGEYSTTDYYRWFSYTYEYDLGEDSELSSGVIKSLMPRGTPEGWCEIEFSNEEMELKVGSTMKGKAYKIDEEGKQTSHSVTFTLESFLNPLHNEITAYASPTSSEKKTFTIGMLIGTFNVATMAY